MKFIGRLALLVLAFILILTALGSSIGVVELGALGLLLAVCVCLMVWSGRRGRAPV